MGADDGTLTFMVWGNFDTYSNCKYLFDIMGKNSILCGEIGAGQSAKICNNMLLASTMIAVGESFNFNRGTIVFESIKKTEGKNYKSIIGYFKITENNTLTELKPELRVYNQPVTVTSEADIKTSLYSDKFIVMNLVKDNEFFNVRYQVKPFMIWIWLSTILLAAGGVLSLINRKYEK